MERSRKLWDFASVLDDAWSLLERGATDAAAGMHYPVMATRGLDDLPNARTLLLWRADRAERRLYFNTDARSPKYTEITRTPWALLVFYEHAMQTQLRIHAHVHVRRDDALTDAAWRDLPAETRRVFATPVAPGHSAPVPIAGPPLEAMYPHADADAAGLQHFVLLEAVVAHLDWLYIAPTGHRRAAFTWSGAGDPQARWLYP